MGNDQNRIMVVRKYSKTDELLATPTEKANHSPSEFKLTKNIMITTKLRNIYLSAPVLNALVSQRMPANIAMKLVRIRAAVATEMSNFETLRVEKIKQYGSEIDGVFSVPPDTAALFEQDMNIALDVEIELSVNTLTPENLDVLMLTVGECELIEYLVE